MDDRTVTLCGPWRTGGGPGPRQHVRGRPSKNPRVSTGRGWGRRAMAFCRRAARLAALCTLTTLPGTQGGLCFPIGYTDTLARCGTFVAVLRCACGTTSADVSSVSKQFKAFGRRHAQEEGRSRETKKSQAREREREQRAGNREASVSQLMQSDVLFPGSVAFPLELCATPQARPQRAADGYEKSAICLIRPVIRSRRAKA